MSAQGYYGTGPSQGQYQQGGPPQQPPQMYYPPQGGGYPQQGGGYPQQGGGYPPPQQGYQPNGGFSQVLVLPLCAFAAFVKKAVNVVRIVLNAAKCADGGAPHRNSPVYGYFPLFSSYVNIIVLSIASSSRSEDVNSPVVDHYMRQATRKRRRDSENALISVPSQKPRTLKRASSRNKSVQSMFNAQHGVFELGNDGRMIMHQNTNEPSFLQPQWDFPAPQSQWFQEIMVNTQFGSCNVRSPFPIAINTRRLATDFRRATREYRVVPDNFSKICYGPSTYVLLCKQDVAEDLRKWQKTPGWICGPGPYRCLWPGCLAKGCFASKDLAIIHVKVEHIQHCLLVTEQHFQQQIRKTAIAGFRWKTEPICDSFCSLLSSYFSWGTLDKLRQAGMYAGGGLGAYPLKLYFIEQGGRGFNDYQKQSSDSVGTYQARTTLWEDPKRTPTTANNGFSFGSNATLFSSVKYPAHDHPITENSGLESKIAPVQIEHMKRGHSTKAVSDRSTKTTESNVVEDYRMRSTKAIMKEVSSTENPSSTVESIKSNHMEVNACSQAPTPGLEGADRGAEGLPEGENVAFKHCQSLLSKLGPYLNPASVFTPSLVQDGSSNCLASASAATFRRSSRFNRRMRDSPCNLRQRDKVITSRPDSPREIRKRDRIICSQPAVPLQVTHTDICNPDTWSTFTCIRCGARYHAELYLSRHQKLCSAVATLRTPAVPCLNTAKTSDEAKTSNKQSATFLGSAPEDATQSRFSPKSSTEVPRTQPQGCSATQSRHEIKLAAPLLCETETVESSPIDPLQLFSPPRQDSQPNPVQHYGLNVESPQSTIHRVKSSIKCPSCTDIFEICHIELYRNHRYWEHGESMFYPELEQSIHVDVHNEWKAIHPEAAGVTPEEESEFEDLFDFLGLEVEDQVLSENGQFPISDTSELDPVAIDLDV
ncbi:hypothetical protein GLAREA_03821 [Glarea lozoyensis ATCC 20868]|uniref:Uncharacterized protein n=1 Tax=Glarea lozoyensis (strain ATCC 20868 / MF5171) TaxID=1116229 RepID=S3D130_GLAL2|nr:uncharacterized protein GLAREA_03821 [Glarea lozoyensis ATCC 20868]EPE30854.1 hypothetical protein GLAREA_03821 [Glarea lozoyensis ATCC 20868]